MGKVDEVAVAKVMGKAAKVMMKAAEVMSSFGDSIVVVAEVMGRLLKPWWWLQKPLWCCC